MGDTLSFFAAGIVLFALFIASYSRRSTWLALGSMAMSMAVLFGCLFLVTIHDRSQVRARLAWAASELPFLLDQQTAADLAESFERAPVPVSTQPASRPAEPEPVQAAAAAGWLAPKPDAKIGSQYPVAWRLDEADVQPASSGDGIFLINGTNVSDQALEEVHAVLKPDASQREVELALAVDGDDQDGTVIPAAARFSLVSASPNQDGALIRGAILTFRYSQAGQRKSSILYLTPSMLARFANR